MTAPELHQLILRIVGKRNGIEPDFLVNSVSRHGFTPEAVQEAIDELLQTEKLDFHIQRHGLAYLLPEGGAHD